MGRPPQIDRQSVLAASLQLADEGGLAAVTMQAVADRVGVTPMALYRHVTNKADLLDGVVESLLADVPAPDASLEPVERLQAMARGVRQAARRHPTVFPLLLQRPATTPGARRAREAVYAALRELGLSPEDVPRVERLVSTLMLGFAASEVSGRFASSSAESLDADFAALGDWVGMLLADRAAVGVRSGSGATTEGGS